MYVADWKNNRVRKISTAGLVSTFAGTGTLADTGDGGTATSASVTTFTLTVDSLGNVYLADACVVRKIDTTGKISTVAGSYNVAGGVICGNSGDNGLAVNAEFEGYLAGIAVDSQQNIYIADTDNQRVRKVTKSTGIITTIAGNGTGGYNGDGISATTAELQSPAGLAFDKSGNLYIADNVNCRVRMVAASGTISTVAGDGACGSAGNYGLAIAAEINNPWGVVVDGSGNLYITQGNPATGPGNSIRKVSGNVAAGTGTITTVAGVGTLGYSGDAGPAASAQFDNPLGLAVDPVDSAANIYVADFGNSAVRVLQPETEPLLTVASTHTGSFPPGRAGTFMITVSNAPSAATSSGPITVTATLSSGLTPAGMSGTGWSNCTLGASTASCTNSGAVSGRSKFGKDYAYVNVASGAPPQVTNQVVVSGGGALATGAEELCPVSSSTPVLQFSATHSGNFVAGAQGAFTITVGNQIAAAPTSGEVGRVGHPANWPERPGPLLVAGQRLGRVPALPATTTRP